MQGKFFFTCVPLSATNAQGVAFSKDYIVQLPITSSTSEKFNEHYSFCLLIKPLCQHYFSLNEHRSLTCIVLEHLPFTRKRTQWRLSLCEPVTLLCIFFKQAFPMCIIKYS